MKLNMGSIKQEWGSTMYFMDSQKPCSSLLRLLAVRGHTSKPRSLEVVEATSHSSVAIIPIDSSSPSDMPQTRKAELTFRHITNF